MIAASAYRTVPRFASRRVPTTAASTLKFIRFAASTAPAPTKPSSNTSLGSSDPNANIPTDADDFQEPGFIKGKKAPFDIETKVYNNAGIAAQDDDKFLTTPSYPHIQYTEAGVYRVHVTHRPAITFGDKVSYYGTMFARHCFDFVTGYACPPPDQPDKYVGTRWEMTEGKWMTRVIFLEAVAGVPGGVAGFVRHLHSLRMLTRDKAWIQTLQDEAYNERMHLLTFIKIGKPSWFTRFIIYVGQGVFTNIFFFMYLWNPRYCHRFVGYLEEEAVRTYTHLIDELSTPGKLKDFQNMTIPTIAVDYWPTLDQESSFKDLILRIRADESKHREVNHTFANLEIWKDRNPFALKIKDDPNPQPNYGLDVVRPEGWPRKDLYL
ncbi:Alternative oxidase 1, mitochondrial [Candida viswanathii]|uniref:Alternative oxidase n=1 Tax=Candida viswanathii TaxID=5486 RepID=A0A367YDU5_9ASCO|nr:Alternative oxidase 1, mitochondrial [Candida viswanathii]